MLLAVDEMVDDILKKREDDNSLEMKKQLWDAPMDSFEGEVVKYIYFVPSIDKAGIVHHSPAIVDVTRLTS